MKKVKRCVVGLSCGFSCIAKKKKCSERVTQRVAKILSSAAEVIRAQSQPAKQSQDYEALAKDTGNWLSREDYKTVKQGDGLIKTKTKYGDEVTVGAITYPRMIDNMGPMIGAEVTAVEVDFRINGSYDKNTRGMTEERRVSAGYSAMKTLKEKLKTLPDGTLLSNSPHKDDGNGDYRKRVYSKLGFMKNGENEMFAVKFGNKLYPVSKNQLIDYSDRLAE